MPMIRNPRAKAWAQLGFATENDYLTVKTAVVQYLDSQAAAPEVDTAAILALPAVAAITPAARRTRVLEQIRADLGG